MPQCGNFGYALTIHLDKLRMLASEQAGPLIAYMPIGSKDAAMVIKIANEKEYKRALRRLDYFTSLERDSEETKIFNALVVAVKLYNNHTYKVHNVRLDPSSTISIP